MKGIELFESRLRARVAEPYEEWEIEKKYRHNALSRCLALWQGLPAEFGEGYFSPRAAEMYRIVCEDANINAHQVGTQSAYRWVKTALEQAYPKVMKS